MPEHTEHLRAACEQQSSLINRSTAASRGLTNALKQASQTLDNQTSQLRSQRQCIISLERTRDQALQLLTESESVRRSMGEIIAQKKLAVAQLQRETRLLRKQADMQGRLLNVLAPDLLQNQSAAAPRPLATSARQPLTHFPPDGDVEQYVPRRASAPTDPPATEPPFNRGLHAMTHHGRFRHSPSMVESDRLLVHDSPSTAPSSTMPPAPLSLDSVATPPSLEGIAEV